MTVGGAGVDPGRARPRLRPQVRGREAERHRRVARHHGAGEPDGRPSSFRPRGRPRQLVVGRGSRRGDAVTSGTALTSKPRPPAGRDRRAAAAEAGSSNRRPHPGAERRRTRSANSLGGAAQARGRSRRRASPRSRPPRYPAALQRYQQLRRTERHARWGSNVTTVGVRSASAASSTPVLVHAVKVPSATARGHGPSRRPAGRRSACSASSALSRRSVGFGPERPTSVPQRRAVAPSAVAIARTRLS